MIKPEAFVLCAACLAGPAGAQIYDIKGIQLTQEQMADFYRRYGDGYALTTSGPRPVDGQAVLRVSGRVRAVLSEGWLRVSTAEGRTVVVQPRIPKSYADGDSFFGAGVRTGVYVVSNEMGTASTYPLVAGGELSWKEFVDAAGRGQIPLPKEFHPAPSPPPKPQVISPQGFRVRKLP